MPECCFIRAVTQALPDSCLCRHEAEAKEAASALRGEMRQTVMEDIRTRMMGLHDDPRIVLQVLGIPCEGGSNPSHEQLLRGLRKVCAFV